MDSPHLQSISQPQRIRTNSNLSVHSIDQRGGVRKRSLERSRSISTSQTDRLQQLVLDPSAQSDFHSLPSTTSAFNWITPQHSPQPQTIFPDSSIEPFPSWSVPTPPHSDSGLPTVSIDVQDESASTGISSSQDYCFGQPTTSAEMSSLGLLLPSQYGSTLYESEPGSYAMDQNYMPPIRVTQSAATSGSSAYAQASSSTSPALYQSRTAPDIPLSRRHSELAHGHSDSSSYAQNFRRISTSYDSSSAQYPAASSQTIPSISGLTQSPMPSPHMGGSTSSGSISQYSSSMSRSPNPYDSTMYQQSYTSSPSATHLYASAQSMSYPPPFVGSSVNEVLAKPLGSESSIRVLNQRPKPQCWEHGCNGRQFSTFSNLLRHQREKSGSAPKSYCPKCGAEFTRTTARNGHLAHDKCTRQRRPSDDDK